MKLFNFQAYSGLVLGALLCLASAASWGSSGTEGAAFLDIPVGGGPAALGAAYTALASDAYAATWNPGGLGFVESTQFAGQHLAYLDTIHYEYLSFAVPLPRSISCPSTSECPGSGLGGSIQYLGSGDLTGRDLSGNPTGDFSSYYAAYNLSYGRAFGDKLSLGLTGKMIHANIDDVSASAYAADLGTMYKVRQNLMLAATVTNLGTQLTFLDEGDSLPMAVHLAAAYEPTTHWMMTSELVYPKTGLFGFHAGTEWRPVEMLALRVGYKTETTKKLSPMAGFTTGVGVRVWGQELAYAWLPYGDLGSTHYISLLMKFGEVERAKRNLIQYQNIKSHRSAGSPNANDATTPDYQQLMELMNEKGERMAQPTLPNRESRDGF